MWMSPSLYALLKPQLSPPPAGLLPFGGGEISEGSDFSHVYFKDAFSGTYTGMDGFLLKDTFTVLTSGYVAETIQASPSSYKAVMGTTSVLMTGTATQVADCMNAYVHTSYSGYSDLEYNIGYVVTSGFSPDSTYVDVCEYSNAPDAYPFPGDYFYPAGTNVVFSTLVRYLGGFPSYYTHANGIPSIVLSIGDAETALGYSLPTTVLPVSTGGMTDGALGSGLLVAGYGSYFCAGVLIQPDVSDAGATLFTHLGNKASWIETQTGVSPITYP